MTRAAQYGPAPVLDNNFTPMAGVAVTVVTGARNPIPGAPLSSLTAIGSAAVLYTDISGATPTGSNMVNADSSGNLTFFAPAGVYVLTWPIGNAISVPLVVTLVMDLVNPPGFVSDDATKGLVLKDSNGHYWRATVSTGGVIGTADLGTTRPSA